MATETVTIIDAVRDWLLLVGAEYGIYEAHHIQRPDDGLKVPADYFIFRFELSEQITTQPADNSTASGNDGDLDFYASFHRDLRIECHSEHGMEILEALFLSAWHPAVEVDILGAARLVIVDMPPGISNETTGDETKIDHLYTCTFRVRKNTHFAVTRENHIWSNYSATGTLTLPDDVTTLPVAMSDT